jgi:hypothetical protein
MKIIGIEEVQEFTDSGISDRRCNMIVETGAKQQQFRVPINSDTYSMLADLGSVLSSYQAEDETPQVESRRSLPEQPTESQSLEDFVKAFISTPPQAAEQQDMEGRTTETPGSDLIESFEDTSNDDDGESVEQL